MNRQIALVLSVIALQGIVATAHAEALRICLDENTPYATHQGKDAKGFDVAVAAAIAKRLNRTLEIQWFETELDNDASPFTQQNALMSDGHCQLVGGYSLYRAGLGKPGAETARLPSFEGIKPGDRRRQVPLGTMVPSRAYHYAPLTVLLGPKVEARHIGGIGDLQGLKLGAEETTLADNILMSFGTGRYVKQVTHVVPGRNELLPRLENGDYEAVLIPLARFDAYRSEHPDTKIKTTGYYYRIGFNMGFATLESNQKLLSQVDAAIADMLAKNEIAPLAEATGITFVAPRPPDVLEHISILEFFND
jgi:ABC-type amino acid transport substrate-binding protein